MTEETLTHMYGIPVDVDEMHGHRIVVARRASNGNGASGVASDATPVKAAMVRDA